MRSVDPRTALAALLIAAVLCAVLPGCMIRGGRGDPGAAFMLGLFTAAAIHHAILLEQHDYHYHDEFCGHYRVWVEDRWMFWYHGHWEYYDYETGRWYMVPAEPPDGRDDEGAED